MALMSGMKSWFGLPARPASHDDLNLITAAEMHILWKARLGHHVAGTMREPLENVLVGQGGFCQLGCWINGPELAPFRELSEFSQLVDAHRRFHHYGGQIVDQLRRGERAAARELFGSDYHQALQDMLQALSGISSHLRK